MSTQLILYPQHYDGYSYDWSLNYVNYIVDGAIFATLNSSDIDSNGYLAPWDAAIAHSPPTSVNTWYRYKTQSGAPSYGWSNVAAPQGSGNGCYFSYSATNHSSGIYQKLSGLTIGVQYEITIDSNFSIPADASVRIWTYVGGSYYGTGGPVLNSSTLLPFTMLHFHVLI